MGVAREGCGRTPWQNIPVAMAGRVLHAVLPDRLAVIEREPVDDSGHREPGAGYTFPVERGKGARENGKEQDIPVHLDYLTRGYKGSNRRTW